VTHELPSTDPSYIELRSRQFLVDESCTVAGELLAAQVRTRHQHLADFTALHIFVVTLRCEHSCHYCQVSRRSQNTLKYDMSHETALDAVDLAFRSPNPNIKIEFQGGEPLLNFPLLESIVLESEERNKVVGKNLAFVIATNLAMIDDRILDFCRSHSILLSTSLDGPRDLHNANRPRPGHNSYELAVDGIRRAREVLGQDRISALMTTTEKSLTRVRDIVDEYVTQGFDRIFLRPLAPYGFALKTKSYQSYNTSRWLEFYREGIDYIIDLNRKGTDFTEFYAQVILRKMLTSEDPRYVDLMSPSGIGLAAVVYNYDGYVYASDEGRMLAESGDFQFRLGRIPDNSYDEIFSSPRLLEPLVESFAYSAPMCNDCAFEPYCGADPVHHWGFHKDYVGRKPESDFCKRNMELCRLLITKMEEDPFAKRLFWKWANRE